VSGVEVKGSQVETSAFSPPIQDIRIIKIFPGYTLYRDRRSCFDFNPDWEKLGDLSTWTATAPQVLAAWQRFGIARARLLSVGCGIGVDCKWFHDNNIPVDYHGCDTDASSIDSAIAANGKTGCFSVCSGTELPFSDRAFDVVMFPSSLNYIEDVEAAVAEGTRVSDKFIIATSTIVVNDGATKYYRRNTKSFGIYATIPEIVFDESALAEMFVDRGFIPRRSYVNNKRYLPLPNGDFCTAHQKTLCFDRPR